EWCRNASMIITVLAKKEFDCIIKGREYCLFDIGLATENIILRATELGFVAHPIAGYSEEKVKEILNIPQDFQVICLIIVGKKDENGSLEILNEKQKLFEEKRPERLKEEFVWSLDSFNDKLNTKPNH
ncbi:MAG: nitroreductase family protein, partial [Chitinispirillaceae bacterium]|nr:nitroreductase family protein [Chitinispirillaceae bacterium]